MAKKSEAQKEVDRLTEVLAQLEGQQSELQERGERLQAEIRAIEDEAKIPGMGLRITDYEDLGAQAMGNRRALRLFDHQIEAVKTELAEARVVANAAEIAALRPAEKRKFQALQSKVRELVEAVDDLQAVHTKIGQSGGQPRVGLVGNFDRLARYMVTEWDQGRDPLLKYSDW